VLEWYAGFIRGIEDAAMFLRSTLVKSGDKKIRYWKLVENYHTERGTRQRVVAHLGSLENFTAEDWRNLAERLGQPDMAAALEYRVKNVRRGRPGTRQAPYKAEDGEEAVRVYLSSLSWENPRSYGDVYVALRFWQRLGLGKLFSELLTGRSAETNRLVAALMAANRLIDPASELGMLGWWPRTGLPALLGLPVDKVDDNRLYRCLDAILAHKERIEEHLAKRGRELYGREYVALLYDLTSTYFEGSAEGIEKAKRGYSRDSRPDAKQVTIGVVVDWDGYPLGYEVFEGNIRDHATVAGTLAKLKDHFGVSSPTVCMDRGMVTEETLSLLRGGYLWIVTESREKAREYALNADAAAWQVIRRDKFGAPLIEVQEIGCEEPERLVLVRSAGCAVKEKGIHHRLLSRMKRDLDSLSARVTSGKLKVSAKIERAVGRIFERYPGMSRWVKPEYASEVRENEGVYVLRTNLRETSPEDVWKRYMTLTRVESTFRSLKQELRLRPVFHQKGGRVEAHILLSYVAYVLLWCIEHTHRSHGGTLTGRRVLDVLSGIELATITLRAGDGRKIALERISSPRTEEAQVLDTLGIRLPRKPRAHKPPDLQLSLIDSGDQFSH
jgi:transposase